MKTLYHYTCLEHLPKILAAGLIKTTESNLSIERTHAGPDVVWLTTDPDCKHGHGIGNNSEYAAKNAMSYGMEVTPEQFQAWDKTRVRFTVRLPNDHVYKWMDWQAKYQMNPVWKKAFVQASGGGAGTWRVVEHPILQDRWVEIIDRHTGQSLWIPRGRMAAASVIKRTG